MRDERARPSVRRGVRAALAALVVTVLALVGWTRTWPLVDEGEANRCASRVRALLDAPRPLPAPTPPIVQTPCILAGRGFEVPGSPMSDEDRRARCADVGARLAAEWRRDEPISELPQYLGAIVELVVANDGATDDVPAVLTRGIQGLWLAARYEGSATDPASGAGTTAERSLVARLAYAMQRALTDEERSHLTSLVARVVARRPRRLALLHREMLDPGDVEPRPSGGELAAQELVRLAHRVELAARVQALGCDALGARACLAALEAMPPVDPPSPVLGVLLGPRFDRCTVAQCSDTREGYVLAATVTAEADLAIALLPTLLAHDPTGSACRGEVQELTVGSDRLRVERSGGRVRIHAPAWLGDPEPLAELPCTEGS